MRLLVLHGPHLRLLRRDAEGQTSLADVNRALELAAAAVSCTLRVVQAETEPPLVEAVHAAADWATHALVSPGALAPTAFVLREALALAKLPFAEVFVSELPDHADLKKRSMLKGRAELQRYGPAAKVYLAAAERLLGVRFLRDPAELPRPKGARRAIAKTTRTRSAKAAGPAIALAPPAPVRAAKTVGRGRAKLLTGPRLHPPPVPDSLRGVSRAAVRSQIAARLAGKITPGQLATWGRAQWLAVERGAATEAGQRELLSETLQALALSTAPKAALSETELIELMARLDSPAA